MDYQLTNDQIRVLVTLVWKQATFLDSLSGDKPHDKIQELKEIELKLFHQLNSGPAGPSSRS